VLLDFAIKQRQHVTVIDKEQIVVATLTMTLFFVAVFVIARFEIGRSPLGTEAALAAKLFGCLTVLFAAAVNIAGRIALGHPLERSK